MALFDHFPHEKYQLGQNCNVKSNIVLPAFFVENCYHRPLCNNRGKFMLNAHAVQRHKDQQINVKR